MKKLAATAVILSTFLVASFVHADDASSKRSSTTTVAVFGDWPYSAELFDKAPMLISSINSDPDVSLIIHLGDIHSGSMPCTSAGVSPLLPGSDPDWNRRIFNIFAQFSDPLIYTPGDNEWTDCHKSKQKSSGYPLRELEAVRNLFFPKAGRTIGGQEKKVSSQARDYDRRYRADSQFVENAMLSENKLLFVTLNVPGSNNDLKPWTGIFADPAAQEKERIERTDADMRWLAYAFRKAKRDGARAVVIALQADMWDPEAAAPGGDGLDGYAGLVKQIAKETLAFGKPVLLLNGDSHVFGTDRPLADPNSTTGKIHGTPAVPNLTRVTVQGSTNKPYEWLRLTIAPSASEVFRFDNTAY